MIEDKPKQWHDRLSEALWACRNSKSTATGFTPYRLTYGQDAVLPVELAIPSVRVQSQMYISADEYKTAMMQELEESDVERMTTIDQIERNKDRIARSYNKHVRRRNFSVGDLVWKTILPARKDCQFGKWSPNWEGPYIIKQAYSGGHASSLQETEKREALLLMGDT